MKMSRWIIGVLVGLGVVWMSGRLAVAAEHGGQEHGGAATAGAKEHAGKEHGGATAPAQPAAPAAEQPPAPAATAPAAPAPAQPAIRPIVIKFSGEVVQVNRQNPGQPMLTVRDRYGVTKEMSVDPAAIKVMRGTNAAGLDDVKQGDQVAVDYTYDVATGKRNVQSVTIAEATPAPAQSSAATQKP